MEIIGDCAANEVMAPLGSAGTINLRGAGSSVRLAADCATSPGFWIDVGSDCSIDIAENCTLHNLFIHCGDRVRIRVGRDSGFSGHCRLLAHEPGSISIGNGCLFGGDVDISVSDMHSIVEVSSGRRLNPPADVEIDDRVWVGQRSLLLKGTTIGVGTVVGAGAVVTSTLPGNSLCVGVPARVVRSGISWHHELLPLD